MSIFPQREAWVFHITTLRLLASELGSVAFREDPSIPVPSNALHALSTDPDMNPILEGVACWDQIDKLDKHGVRPIYYAAVTGNRLALNLLINQGANPEEADRWGNSIIHAMAEGKEFIEEQQYAPLLRHLIDKGLVHDLSPQNDSNWEPIHIAAQRGNAACIDALVDLGVVPDRKEKITKYTPLHLAVNHGHLQAVQTLVDREASLDCVDAFGYSPPELAIARGNPELIAYFQMIGAFRPFALNERGETWLSQAILSNRFDLAQGILELYARDRNVLEFLLHEKDGSGTNAYSYGSNHPEIFSQIFILDEEPQRKKGIQIDAIERTSIHEVLSDPRACFAPDDEGKTGLHSLHIPVPCSPLQKRQLRETIPSQELSRRDSLGNTPLHYAAEKGIHTYQLLLDLGADPKARNTSGRSPTAHAVCGNNLELLQLLPSDLIQKERDAFGQSLLHLAAIWGTFEIFVVLSEIYKLSPTEADNYGRTPASQALAHGKQEIIEFLNGDFV